MVWLQINAGKIQEAEELLDAVVGNAGDGRSANLGAFVARGTARALQRKLEGETGGDADAAPGGGGGGGGEHCAVDNVTVNFGTAIEPYMGILHMSCPSVPEPAGTVCIMHTRYKVPLDTDTGCATGH